MTPNLLPRVLPAAPGTYVLWLLVSGPLSVAAGRLGVVSLSPGWYAYIGSAQGPGGLRARVGRHLRPHKTQHWHIDALTAAAPVVAIWLEASGESLECAWAATLAAVPGVIAPVAGFGASDCACRAHLLTVPDSARRPAWVALENPVAMTWP